MVKELKEYPKRKKCDELDGRIFLPRGSKEREGD